MKKIFKMFLILPIFIVLALFGVACEDDSLKSITVNSITNLTTNEEFITPDRGYYKLNRGDSFEINISTNPNKYGISDLTWASSDTYVVSINNNIIRALNVGYATITVSYKNANNDIIKTSFEVDVNSYAPEITFYNLSNNIEYRGVNLLTQTNLTFTADQDTSDYSDDGEHEFTYSYYDVNNRRSCTEIVNAGKYRVTAVQRQENGTTVSSTKEITVLPKTITIEAGSFTKIYGGKLPDKIINESDIQNSLNETTVNDNVFFENGVGKDINLKVIKYVKYVSNNVNQTSNIGSYNVKIAYELNNSDNNFANNYTIQTIDGNLNILSKTVIIVPKNQTITYGQTINLNDYTIYSYEVNENGNWLGENGSINYILDKNFYSSNFIVNSPAYYLKNDELIGAEASLNSAGYLNANDYFYRLNVSALNNNIKIANNLEKFTNNSSDNPLIKTINVNKRNVTVCPTPNQSKVYLQNDPSQILFTLESGSFVGGDAIKNFLYINYPINDISGKTINYGEGNFKAPVNNYFYQIKTTEIIKNANNEEEEVELNPNYNIMLSTSAKHEDSIADSNKIRFEVKILPIYIEFTDVSTQYKNPIVSNGNEIQTVSYFNRYILNNQDDTGLDVNYFSNIKQLTFNNKKIIENNNILNENIFDNIYIEKASSFSENGKFIIKYKKNNQLENEEILSEIEEIADLFYKIELGNEIPNTNYYESYYLKPVISCSLEDKNYSYSYLTSTTLNLTKITIKIYPNENASSMSKIYDATSDLPENFGLFKSNIVPYTFDDLGEEGLTLDDVLQVKSTGNSFNSNSDSIISTNLDAGNVGKYKIQLNSDYIENKSAYAYYNFVLDSSKDYYFTVVPRTLFVFPYTNQSKIYGSSDPSELKFSVKNLPKSISGLESENILVDYETLAILNVHKEGCMSRVSGENAGTYQILIGNLNFGSNYITELEDSISGCFTINRRGIQITPVEYTTTYGDDYPSEIAYNYIEMQNELSPINNQIYKAPEKKDFSGSFALGVYNGETGEYTTSSKVGNYYLAGTYSILQGTFNCTSNYEIVFVNDKKFIINQRQVVLNFKSQNKNSTDVLSTQYLNVPSSFYDIPSNLVDYPYTFVMDSLTLEATPSIYYVNDISDIEFKIYKNGIDITSSYEVILGKSVVYTIDVKVIDLVLLNKTNQLNNVQNVVYNGNARDNNYSEEGNEDFVLSCQTEGYRVSLQNDTSFKFKYRKGSTELNEAKDAGAYSVFANFLENDKIVIENIINNQIITFSKTDIDDYLLVDNHLLNFSKIAYLNIEKADISYSQNELSFENAMQYGTNVLPNLKTSNENDLPIFKGVELSEDNFELVSFESITPNTNLNSLYLGKNTIDVTLIPDNASSNYNTLNIKVSLEVVPQQISYTSASFSDSSNFVYNGANKTILLTLNSSNEEAISAVSNKYQITYDYRRLPVVYNDSTKADILYYDYFDSIDSEQRQISLENLGNVVVYDFEIKDSYLVYQKNKAFEYSNSESGIPINAGVYLCFATCVLDEHYIFMPDTEEYPMGTSITFATIFEIEKMGRNQISINNWKEDFKFTTVFDFNNPSTLPFEYDVYPEELKPKIQYVLNQKLENRPLSNVLSVDSYRIGLKIDEQNYFIVEEKSFNVQKLDARIITPSTLTYVYNGNEIVSYLQNIGAVLINKDGQTEATEYYYSNIANFKLTYYQIKDDNELLIANEEPIKTKEVGYYKIHIEYGVKHGFEEGKNPNYYGCGDYYFSIIPAPYTGTVTFKDSKITYNPNYTIQDFYSDIINNKNIFNIDSSTSDYTLSMYNVTNSNNRIVIYDEDGYNEEDFYNYYKVGQIKISIEVNFNDETIASSSKEAWLTIIPMSITDKDFLKFTTDATKSTYNGYEVYQDLTLLPQATATSGTWGKRLIPNTFYGNNEITINYNLYQYNISYNSNNNEYEVKDKLNNTIFKLSYSYYQYMAYSENNDKYESIDSVPISPAIYKVVYNITVGNEYLTTSNIFLNFKEKSFIISKVEVLNISFSAETVFYNGNDYRNTYTPKDFRITNDPNITNTNMRYKLVYDNNYIYSEKDGVCLYIYFTENTVLNAGRYKIKLTLLNNNSYDISKYFNSVSTSSVTDNNSFTSAVYSIYNTETIQSDDFRNEDKSYKNIFENWLTISKVKINTENYALAISFDKPVTLKTDSTNNSRYLEIKASTILSEINTNFQVNLCDFYRNTITSNLLVNYSFLNPYIIISTEEEKTYYYLSFKGDNCDEAHSYVKILIVND